MQHTVDIYGIKCFTGTQGLGNGAWEDQPALLVFEKEVECTGCVGEEVRGRGVHVREGVMCVGGFRVLGLCG